MLPKVNLVKTSDALYALFQTNDGISNDIRSTGSYGNLKNKSLELCKGVSEPLILDIGANLGSYCIPLALELRDAGGEVIAFEPQRIVYYQLCCNIFLNRLDNIHAHYSAVGECSGSIEMPEINYEINSNIGAFSLIKEYRDVHGISSSIKEKSVTTPMIALDDFNVNRPPCLIKLDVEGYELSVLKGGAEFLKRNGLPTILFEVWDFPWYREQKQEIINFLKSLNYDIDSINGVDFIATSSNKNV